MKITKISVLSIISLFLLTAFLSADVFSQCTYTYSPQTSGVTTNLYSVKAVDNNVGWAAGTGAVVRRTVNGGITWTNANPNVGVISGDIYNIEAFDSSNAWCTTSPAATFIYKTTNGGTTWTVCFTQAGGFIDVIKMQSLLSGYAIGDPVGGTWVILSTVDGGLNWTQLATAPPQVAGETGFNNSAQVSLPNIWYGTSTGKVYHTSNAGVTWTGVLTPGNSASGVTGVRFNLVNTGFSTGAVLDESTDGGASYNTATAPGTGTISGIAGNVDSSYFYTRGAGIYYSNNNGVTFTSAYTAPTGTYTHLDLALSGLCVKGWAVSNNGAITKIDGNPTGIIPISGEVPAAFSLSQNYPNPFNPSTNFNFALPKSTFVSIKIYDVIGREVAVLSNDVRPAGTYKVEFDASNLPSGIYFYSLQTSEFTNTKKMMLVK